LQARPCGARLRVDTEIKGRRHQDQVERPIKAAIYECRFDTNVVAMDGRNVGLAYECFSTAKEKSQGLEIDPGSARTGAKWSLAGLSIAKSVRRRGAIVMQTARSGPVSFSAAIFSTPPATTSGHPGNPKKMGRQNRPEFGVLESDSKLYEG